MAKYEVEYARFAKVTIEAESQEEANAIAAMMDEEEIEEKSDKWQEGGFVIWNEPKLII